MKALSLISKSQSLEHRSKSLSKGILNVKLAKGQEKNKGFSLMYAIRVKEKE
jgi:hypothetical protein